MTITGQTTLGELEAEANKHNVTSITIRLYQAVVISHGRRVSVAVGLGTNYYLKTAPCPHCGHSGSSLHIGKSSAGWNFGLRIYPLGDETEQQLKPFGTNRIDELEHWIPLFATFSIFDEYDRPVTVEDMIETINDRSHPRGLLSRLTAGPEHMGHWDSSQEDIRSRKLRAGKGTYDLCNWEFS